MLVMQYSIYYYTIEEYINGIKIYFSDITYICEIK